MLTPIATALLVFVAFLVGCVLGRFERDDRRITHEPVRTIQLQQWQRGLVREVGNRRKTNNTFR